MFPLHDIISDVNLLIGEVEGEKEEFYEILIHTRKIPSKKSVTLKSTYDSDLVKDITNNSKRFNNLKPEKLLEIQGKQHKFDYLKKYAILRLESNFMKQLTIFGQMMDYGEESDVPSGELAHGIFSWYWQDFKRRRDLTNFVWVDVLLRTRENDLHMYKFQQDLKQLEELVKKIFAFLYSNMENEEFDFNTHIVKTLNDIKKVLHITDKVEDHLHKNAAKLKQFLHKEKFVGSARRDSEENILKQFLECRIWNSHIWDPIQIRYNLNWCRSLIEQTEIRLNSTLENQLSEINDYNNKTELETFIDGNGMDFFYATIEIYKSRIVEMEEKYERKTEIMDNKLAYMRIQIEKLREQRKLLADEIERFHIEEDLMRERIGREEEQKRLNEEAEAEQILQSAMQRISRKSAGKPKDVKDNATRPKEMKGKVSLPKGGGKKKAK